VLLGLPIVIDWSDIVPLCVIDIIVNLCSKKHLASPLELVAGWPKADLTPLAVAVDDRL
jgi:hypothetical protein